MDFIGDLWGFHGILWDLNLNQLASFGAFYRSLYKPTKFGILNVSTNSNIFMCPFWSY